MRQYRGTRCVEEQSSTDANALGQTHHGQRIRTGVTLGVAVCGDVARLSRTWRSLVPRRRAMKILLIDDDPLILRTYADLLGVFGHLVTGAARGEDGIAWLQSGWPVDVVITDLRMPGLDGWDVVRTVRKRWPSLRVGVISADPEAIAERPEPVDFALEKPLDHDTFKTVLDLLARRQPETVRLL